MKNPRFRSISPSFTRAPSDVQAQIAFVAVAGGLLCVLGARPAWGQAPPASSEPAPAAPPASPSAGGHVVWHSSADSAALLRELVDRGSAAYRRGAYDQAIQAFTLAYALEGSPLLLFNVAQAERRAGHLREAQVLYQAFLGVAGADPLRAEATTYLAAVQADQGLTPAQAEATDPTPALLREGMERSAAQYSAGQYEAAARGFALSYAVLPDRRLLFNLAQAQRRAGHLREAVALYQRFLNEGATEPLRSEAQGHLDEAQRALRGAGGGGRVRVGLSLGTGAVLLGASAQTEVAWTYDGARYAPAAAGTAGFAGVSLQGEGLYRVRGGLWVGGAGRVLFYLDHNAESIGRGGGCSGGSCYATVSKGSLGGLGLVRLRWERPWQVGRVSVRPFVRAELGGGVWRGSVGVGAGDAAHPTTDVCSAQSPEQGSRWACNAVGGAPGYNVALKQGVSALPVNRVCADGACKDAVQLGGFAVGGGGGVYVGGARVGVALDLGVLGLVGGGQAGALVDVYLGPQLSF